MHRVSVKVSIFYEIEEYLVYIESTLSQSIYSVSLIFSQPDTLISEIKNRNLGHRLNLFMFFWRAKSLPKTRTWNLDEPIRVVIIIRPRSTFFRIFYNQATAKYANTLRAVNVYDELGLKQYPLLPNAADAYKDFGGRTFYVPVIHVSYVIIIIIYSCVRYFLFFFA